MPNITKAAQALREKRLTTLVRTSEYGIIAWSDYVKHQIAAGGRVEAAEYSDYALRAKLEAEYELMNRGFHVPWGNDRHPKTIQAQALKDRLAGQIYSIQYRLYGSDPDTFSIINKTIYEYASSLMAAQRTAQ